MTSSHIFYIPMMIIVGLIIGFLLGRKAMLAEIEQQRRREERRAGRPQKD
jgi:heme exporter protein D